MLTRRDFLANGLALGAAPLVLRSQRAASNLVFRHGVASGDPLPDRVVLWTRVSAPSDRTGPVDVEWLVARDPRMTRVVGRGSVRASAALREQSPIGARAPCPLAT